MKKTMLLSAVALLMLGACSDKDDTPVRPTPNEPVQTVPSVADHVTLNAPAQTEVTPEGSLYRVSYANGQEITYSLQNAGQPEGYIATVKRIGGTASDVVIPASVTYNDITFRVYSITLYLEGCTENVTSLTIPNTAVAMVSGTAFAAATPDHLRVQISQMPGLQKVELEDGFPGFCSIKGAIYTDDLSTLISVPRAYPDTFTVAESTKKIDDRALYYCSEIDILTIPASVETIGDEAVVYTSDLLLINCLATTAPEATADTFGTYAHNGVLRVPAGSEANYKFEKPALSRPEEPVEPDEEEATPEEMEAYNTALAAYETAKAEYDEAMAYWTNHAGWADFKNIEGVNF